MYIRLYILLYMIVVLSVSVDEYKIFVINNVYL